MKIRYLFLSVLLITAVILMPVNLAFAAGSGGFRVEMPDAGAFGKGSAFIGEANTPAAVYYNPAGLTQLEGTQVSFGAAALQPLGYYQSNSGDTTQAEINTAFIPHVYAVSNLGIENFVFGVGVTTNWGLTTEWPEDGYSRYVATKSEIEQIDTYITGAYKVNDQWSVGASLDVANSKVNLQKKLFTGVSDGDFQLKGDDVAFGYRLSTLYKLNEQHQFGLMYRSQKRLEYEGKLQLSNLVDGAVSYNTIFGGSSFSTNAQGDLVLPQSIAFGYSYRPNDAWVFNFDVEWFDWQSVEQLGFSFPDVTNVNQLAVLNTGNPAAKDWAGAFSFSFGGEYKYSDALRLRAGYFFHDSPIPEETFDPSLPDTNSHGLTMGFGYDFNDRTTLDMAYSFIYYDTVDIGNPVTDGTGIADIDGEYSQIVNAVLATLSYKF